MALNTRGVDGELVYASFLFPDHSSHLAMAQDPLRSKSRLKQVQDTGIAVPRRQRSRLMGSTGAPRASSESRGMQRAAGRGMSTQAQFSCKYSRSRAGVPIRVQSLPALRPMPVALAPPGHPVAIAPLHQGADGLPSGAVGDVAPDRPDPSAALEPDVVADYWYALTHVGGVFRLENTMYVFQDWDHKLETIRVCRLPATIVSTP